MAKKRHTQNFINTSLYKVRTWRTTMSVAISMETESLQSVLGRCEARESGGGVSLQTCKRDFGQ